MIASLARLFLLDPPQWSLTFEVRKRSLTVSNREGDFAPQWSLTFEVRKSRLVKTTGVARPSRNGA